MQTTNYDYTPLTRTVTFNEAVRYGFRSLTSGNIRTRNIVGSAILLSFFLMYAMGSALSGNFLFIIATPVVVASIIWSVARSSKVQLRIKSFATANKFTYLTGIVTETRPGAIFDIGHSRQIVAGLQSTDAGFYEIANYQYTTGSGKNSHTYPYGYICVKLPRKLPNIVIDATFNNIFSKSTLPGSFGAGKKLSLEGDFDKYFSVYVPEGYERDALYILTPDIMSLLVSEVSKYDIEIVDDNLYLYQSSHVNMQDPATLNSLIVLADKINKELDHQTDYYADERVASRQLNMVDETGRRLRGRFKRNDIVTIFVLLIIIYMLASFIIPFFILAFS